MPRINSNSKKIYGSSDLDQKLTFRERLMKRFEAHEWVRVINPDNERFSWQYLPSHGEKFEYTPDPMKLTYRDSVEAYELRPGESEIIIGENAYVMIEALYKKVVSKNMLADHPDKEPSQALNFNWTDGAAQEAWIERIYLGREQPFTDTVTAIPRTPRSVKRSPTNQIKKKVVEYEIAKGFTTPEGRTSKES